ncbi:MAG: prepilin-type N-terminal cleavage/methylation domain-containing protein [Candidatus Izimaplasma sp.]|nr:prepilin-type N-terminal cleavage/methylation domain-containing protein [Candidatus Izimaplasma bacterium]
MINSKVNLNQKGVTLIELIISIVVGSIVISMLMSILVMSIKAKTTLDITNLMLNESYVISETIQYNIFDLGPQELELIEDSETQTVIHITHLYDITTNNNNIIERDYGPPNPIVDVLIYDKVNQQITYNGDLLHSDNVYITEGSSIELISIDSDSCDLSVGPCEEGIIKLTLFISVELNNGGIISPKEFITTIII